MNSLALVNEAALIANIQTGTGKRFLEAVVSVIESQLAAGGVVNIKGLGTFYTARQGRKVARNPKTQAVIIIPAKKIVKLKPAKNIKESV